MAGKENDAADALSRLKMKENSINELEWEDQLTPLTYQDEVQERINLMFPLRTEQEREPDSAFPLAPDLIRYYQQRDPELKSKLKSKESFTVKEIEGEVLICHNGRIWVPPAIRHRVLEWYQNKFVHAGETRI